MQQKLRVTDVRFVGDTCTPPSRDLYRLTLGLRLYLWVGMAAALLPPVGARLAVEWELDAEDLPAYLTVYVPVGATLAPYRFRLGYYAILLDIPQAELAATLPPPPATPGTLHRRGVLA
jgi:hypothetical protein